MTSAADVHEAVLLARSAAEVADDINLRRCPVCREPFGEPTDTFDPDGGSGETGWTHMGSCSEFNWFRQGARIGVCWWGAGGDRSGVSMRTDAGRWFTQRDLVWQAQH